MLPLTIDLAIFLWVVLPILLVMIMVGYIRHNVNIITKTPVKDLTQIKDNQHLARIQQLQKYGNYIPASAFEARKHYYTNAENGWLDKQKREVPANPMQAMQDPSKMTEMMTKTLINILPQIVLMGWINYFFSGFLAMRLPFSLTHRFKSMLQKGINLPGLDPSWVSSLSWYFLNVFGLKGVNLLLLGPENGADQSTQGMMPQASQVDSNAVFNAEKENLLLWRHKYLLEQSDALLAQEIRGNKY